ncbi:hypothetical protein [Bradyrhizobium sp. JYMT SZCCT0180]|uniref:hypothetical protein n=1 Tax=Bradyrhizobium sp. JYMT SZCCT0180 TaxID=2807666 RepID=UPI001BA9DAF4|nr:hypothetical protein [Bradyrhizobium sp. JYMT SZCCT0180]MBR1211275.1 hypothetical protein [Bradyrhizobium sp. JYMT SZCCT0180]
MATTGIWYQRCCAKLADPLVGVDEWRSLQWSNIEREVVQPIMTLVQAGFVFDRADAFFEQKWPVD